MDQKDQKVLKSKSGQERRSFLKKTAYAAPTLVALGYLSNPTSAFAEYNNQGVPCGGPGQPPCN